MLHLDLMCSISQIVIIMCCYLLLTVMVYCARGHLTRSSSVVCSNCILILLTVSMITILTVYDDPYRGDELWDGWAFRVGTWNVDSLTGRLGELVEVLAERRKDVLCVQETRWRSNCRLFGAIGKKYKLFLMGNEAKTDGVGIFVAEKWADSVVRVERHSERSLVLKMVLGDRLLNVFFGLCSSPRET